MGFELPVVGELEAGVIAHRPVIILALDGIGEGLALGMAGDAGVVGLDVILARRIEDGLLDGIGDMGAAGAMTLLAADIPFLGLLGVQIEIDGMAAVAGGSG